MPVRVERGESAGYNMQVVLWILSLTESCASGGGLILLGQGGKCVVVWVVYVDKD